jgi:hypothetical protein
MNTLILKIIVTVDNYSCIFAYICIYVRVLSVTYVYVSLLLLSFSSSLFSLLDNSEFML